MTSSSLAALRSDELIVLRPSAFGGAASAVGFLPASVEGASGAAPDRRMVPGASASVAQRDSHAAA